MNSSILRLGHSKVLRCGMSQTMSKKFDQGISRFIRAHQGLYEFIKDRKLGKRTSGYGRAGIEPLSINPQPTNSANHRFMNPPQTKATPDDWRDNRYGKGAMKSAEKSSVELRTNTVTLRMSRHGQISLIIPLMNFETISLRPDLRKQGLTQPKVSHYSVSPRLNPLPKYHL
jgi:hypothetical protein